MTRASASSSPAAARLVWAIAAVGIAMIGALLVSYASSTEDGTLAQAFEAVSLVGSLVAFVLCGALIVSRQPRNIVGWLLMIPGLSLPASTLAANWLGAMRPPDQVGPALWVLLWALGWSWILLIFPILHLLLTFPDGRLLSRRWRWVVAIEVTMLAVFLGFTAFAQDLGVVCRGQGRLDRREPDRLPAQRPVRCMAGRPVGDRARGHDHQQRGGRPAPLPARVERGAPPAEVADARGRPVRRRLRGRLGERRPRRRWHGAVRLVDRGIPISVAVAVLRYRLYAIDHIISRTISWAVITVVLVAVFVGGVLGLQAVLAQGHPGADPRRRGVHALRVRAVPAAPPPRPARRGPALRSRPHRCGAHRRRASAHASGTRSPSRRSPPISTRPSTARCRPSTQGLWLRETVEVTRRSGPRTPSTRRGRSPSSCSPLSMAMVAFAMASLVLPGGDALPDRPDR